MFRVIVRDRSSPTRRVHNETQGHAGAARPPASLLQGKTQTHVPEIKAGDIGAVAKLKETQTNDMLGDKADPSRSRRSSFPEPVISYAIEPKSRGDEEKISTALHRLAGRGSHDPLHPRRADQGAAARRPGPVAHRGRPSRS